ncbi:MAG: tRNA uridine-5-carboxymethylaminomethyl(34) synthesis GTPase MnmE [Proteobacteria bacterium]|nr:tRNA uridine-5-carboxymethylaminomethyl(34) synthesis GTPase MnmE [Pseudomonadota bacterium]MBU1737467.1 tRNA uridine-5-carboxymethylaminomethyl(34) synthesis GTPase MnmE [Pseudomonadota bacterium]
MTISRQSPERDSATIAAIATPPGGGGIGIIRISGTGARPALSAIFHPKSTRETRSHQLTYGWIIDPASNRPVDEVMAVIMTAPNSYTREDVVEIQCHSSYLVLQNILALVLKTGARLAEPGEFTKRAFLNGRIDLSQAEAVVELLQAKTGEGHQIAVSQLRGGLYEKILKIRETLAGIRAILEVAIDFPDEDVEIINVVAMRENITAYLLTPLQAMIESADRGKIYREGISVVILGRPNVGKSSLLNSLLKEDRAIVTEIPGTTRDIIEEYLDIKGIPVRIIDTAGIRENAEAVEKIGIRKAREKQQDADLILLLLDGSNKLPPEDLDFIASIDPQKALIVINKIDLVPDHSETLDHASFKNRPVVKISAKTGAGLPQLEEAIFTLVTGEQKKWEPGHDCVPNVRQRNSLNQALAASRRLLRALSENLPPDLIAIEVQSALDSLGDIVGETTTEDILDLIFEKFCIGK